MGTATMRSTPITLFSDNEKYKPDNKDYLFMGVLFAACAANGPSWSPVSRGVVAGRGRAPCSSLAFNRIKTAESSEQK